MRRFLLTIALFALSTSTLWPKPSDAYGSQASFSMWNKTNSCASITVVFFTKNGAKDVHTANVKPGAYADFTARVINEREAKIEAQVRSGADCSGRIMITTELNIMAKSASIGGWKFNQYLLESNGKYYQWVSR